ncbi:unnamed protein product [Kuraishia capsulata CBS 1993]|uniref:SVP1-like protein 2 n=1 Tax=Kuraishia capsulata CBS 1993 TaxID=1382522 RepID=W6MW11_9ASCO|nr:uncharacterized protein KUCA_T00002729001 [Kuraishia capsulata CBS 1993]CDK26755.1 unnamed protein product [Kuraishia capsulata CBS 1993]
MNAFEPISKIPQSKEPVLLGASFNQDQSCFAVGFEHGFRVYSTDPMEPRMKRTFSLVTGKKSTDTDLNSSGIGVVSMLHRTNYVALVGGGKAPNFPVNKVVIWDDLKKKASIILEFMSPVLNVLLSRTQIITILKNQVVIHAFEAKPKFISSYETSDNEYGTGDLSPGTLSRSKGVETDTGMHILAFLGRSIGQIQLVDVSPNGQERNRISIIKAHKGKIRCLVLNSAGTMIASASEMGTLIRVHATSNCSLLYEFRRGVDRAAITSMRFSPSGSKLAVLSDKNTLHVFNVNGATSNRHHFLGKLPMVPNYFMSTWSFVSIHVSEDNGPTNGKLMTIDTGVLGWSSEDSIIILWKLRGRWEKYVIVEKGEVMDQDGSVQKQSELVREAWRGFGDLLEQ